MRRILNRAKAALIFGAASALFAATAASAPPPAQAWQIGPIIDWRNYSVGMPLSPIPFRAGWYFNFPYPSVEAGEVHSTTFRHGSLAGKRWIVLRYRIDAAPGVRFVPQEQPDLPAKISLFFQRRGDNWSGEGRFESHRWYAPDAKLGPIVQGTHEIAVSLADPAWINVAGQRAMDRREGIASAILNADRVGMVFGSSAARGHGVFATGPARFTLLDFRIE